MAKSSKVETFGLMQILIATTVSDIGLQPSIDHAKYTASYLLLIR